MTDAIGLYNLPHLRYQSGNGLSVTGDLVAYTPGVDYESRLTITGSSGLVIARTVEDTLPAGNAITVDQDSKEVVITWPGSSTAGEGSEQSADLPPFTAGLTGWDVDEGWTFNADDGRAVFSDTYGIRCMRSGEYPCAPGQSITASIDVQQGASASYHVTAEVALYWLDATHKVISQSEGNTVVNSSPLIQTSSITAVAPAGTAYVKFVIAGNRTNENKPLWVDNAVWDHQYVVSAQQHSLTIRVKDSLNQTATWSGDVNKLNTDLLTWSAHTTSATQHTYCAAARDEYLVIGGDSGSLSVSTDSGTSWTQHSVCATWIVMKVTYFDGLWYLVSDSRSGSTVWSCADDFVTTTVPGSPSNTSANSKVALRVMNGNLFHATDAHPGVLYRKKSSDSAWESLNIGGLTGIVDMLYHDGYYVVVTSSGAVYRSSDLSTWENTATLNSTRIRASAVLADTLVFSDDSNKYFLSEDGGQSWTAKSGQSLVQATPSMFIGISSSMQTVSTSSDGENWDVRESSVVVNNTATAAGCSNTSCVFAGLAVQGHVAAKVGIP